MPNLKVNCPVCGEEMQTIARWNKIGVNYYCEADKCGVYMQQREATALAALQQRLAELEELAEAAALLDVMDILTGHGKAFRRRHNAMAAIIRKLAEQRKGGIE